MAFRVEGANGISVDATSGVGLNVALTTDKSKAGYVVMVGETDDGYYIGTAERKPIEVTDDYRLRVGMDTPFFMEYFPGTTVNSSIYTVPTTTMTVVQTNGLLTLNNNSSLTTSAVAQVATRRFFPIIGTFGLSYEFDLALSSTPVANTTAEWGAFIASGTSAPTDGVFWRVNASGELRAVVNYNGAETTSSALTFATVTGGANVYKRYAIVIADTAAYFFVNDALFAKINRPNNQGTMTVSPQLPAALRVYNAGSAPASAQQIKCGSITVLMADAEKSKAWQSTMAGAGGMAYQGQSGYTQGQTSNYSNSAAPTAVALVNAYGSGTVTASTLGLGGQFYETASIAANTDGILCAYKVPAGTASVPGRCLYIHGVWISSYIQSTLTSGGNNEQWILAYGSLNNSALNDPSLATTDDLLNKAPRRVVLGSRAVASAAAALTQLTDISRSFTSPIVVQPGEWVIIAKKVVGTASSAGTIAHLVGFDAYFE